MRLWKRSTEPPSDDCAEHGAEFYSVVSWDGSQPVDILDDSDVLRWRGELRPARWPLALVNVFRKSFYVVSNPDGQELFIIRRVKRFPATFEMVEHERVIGQIQLRSILRNKYVLSFSNGETWTIRMPLFTVYFWAESNADTTIWIVVGPSVMRWNILVEPGIDNAHLVPALTFIQREWCVYS